MGFKKGLVSFSEFCVKNKLALCLSFVIFLITGGLDFFLNKIHLSLAPYIFGFIASWGLINTIRIVQYFDTQFADFDKLMRNMISEMKRLFEITKRDEIDSEYLITLSYTPAFGNISHPPLFEDEEKKGKDTYRYYLTNIISKGIKVKLICCNKTKRLEFYTYWSKIKSDDETKQRELINKWEEQATKIIEQIKVKFGPKSVKEVDELHPIFVFTNKRVAFQYTIKANPADQRNEVRVIKIVNPDTVKYIHDALQVYFEENSFGLE